jgi:putative transposase
MARIARVVVPGIPHHVTQRGNDQQAVFRQPRDRDVYVTLLRKKAEDTGLRVVGYCLMVNHIHLVVIPEDESSIAEAIGRAHFSYTQWFNAHYERSGHLWQNRFFSCPLDEGHTCAALVHVELNPVRAGLVGRPWDYEWSSARVHVGNAPEADLLDQAWWRDRWDAATWRELLDAADDTGDLTAIRFHTARGRPLGSEAFVSGLEARLGRRLRPLAVGRPRKNRGQAPISIR